MWKFIIVTIFIGYVAARTDEEVKSDFIKLLMLCSKEHPTNMKKLLELHELKTPTDMPTKCLLACAYKRDGSINSKGMYDLEHAYAFAENVKNGDEKRYENARKLADICNKINDVKVSDGDKGCERAALLFKCVATNAPKLGFKL